ncbi:MAG: argininosuccinate lyase [Acidiferrobacterales bacterium]|nr:argininosuccinate lyase [Acidiferrobacterales bacterium]
MPQSNNLKKLWGGRFSGSTDSLMEAFSASVNFDWRLYRQDIRGSLAHARMLTAVGVLSEEEMHQIDNGLRQIESEIDAGDFQWSSALEDVHMNIEAALTERIGEAGKKLHTGRSRNDQVATDMRLYLREGVDDVCDVLTRLQRALIELAEQHAEDIMPGFTHMQSAQPVTLGHHLLAWNQMLQRDYERFKDCRKRINISPLGCAALAGTSYPIDRTMTAEALGFDSVATNSLDAVADRDFVIEFNAHAALLAVHLSRIAEELVLWSSGNFDFVDLGDGFCTGSSIMPQKKNPDVAELIRGKAGRVNGNLMALLMLMKGQPFTYNRDNQEDKEPMFDTLDTCLISLEVLAAMFPQVRFKTNVMHKEAADGYATATDLADYLVRKGLAFRDAHEVVGKVVGMAILDKVSLDQIPLSQFQHHCDAIESDVYEVLTVEGSVKARNHIGGTAPEQVKIAVQDAKSLLASRS